jgi:hypothetical protein
MYLTCGLGSVVAGEGEVDQVIGFACEAGIAIISALDDV